MLFLKNNSLVVPFILKCILSKVSAETLKISRLQAKDKSGVQNLMRDLKIILASIFEK